MVKKFRKKPVVIEAMQFDGFNGAEIRDWMNGGWNEGANFFIPTLEGVMTASEGDWIIRGVKGEYYPCKPDIFESTYETA